MILKIGAVALLSGSLVLGGCFNAHWDPRRGPSVNLGFPVHGGGYNAGRAIAHPIVYAQPAPMYVVHPQPRVYAVPVNHGGVWRSPYWW